MNYTKFKNSLIDKGITDEVGAKRFTIKLALLTMISGLCLAIVTGSIISYVLSIVVLLISALVFFFSLDYARQDKDSFNSVQAYANKWWLVIPLAVIVLAVLIFFNFI